MNDSLIVPIIKNQRINSCFIRANSHILKKYDEKFIGMMDNDTKLRLLQEAWKQEFSCNLILDGTTPSFLEFDSRSDKFLFFLNFGV